MKQRDEKANPLGENKHPSRLAIVIVVLVCIVVVVLALYLLTAPPPPIFNHVNHSL